MSTPLETAITFCGRGWSPVPVKHKSKSPIEPGWQKKCLTEETVGRHFNGTTMNVGVLLGSASNGLVDIDIDSPVALEMANYYLPSTGAIFGRKSNQRSHWLYQCKELDKIEKYECSDGKAVEIRANGQTVFPGSIHVSGERIEWAREGGPAKVDGDEIRCSVKELAAATMIMPYYLEGSRQDIVGALAGGLARAGWSLTKIIQFISGIPLAADDPEYKSRLDYVDSTFNKFSQGEKVYGFRHLISLTSEDAVAKVIKYLGLGIPQRPDPEPLVVLSVEESEYPVEALGEILGPAACALHAHVKAPMATCGQSILAAASMIAQPYYDVIPPHGGAIPISINALTINESGDRKSAVDKIVMKPVRDLEEQLSDKFMDEVNDYNNDKEAFCEARKHAIAEVKRKKGSRAEIKAALDDLGEPPRAPNHPYLLADDPTMEGLYRSFKEGHPAQGCFTDEGGILVGGYALNGDNLLKTAARLSKLWDGAPFDRARGGDDRGKLFGRRLALHWMMQPDVALELFNRKIMEGQGFFPRCFLAAPTTMAGTRTYSSVCVEELAEITAYHERARLLLGLERWPVDPEDPQKLRPHKLRLSVDAARLYANFHDNYEAQVGVSGELCHVRPFVSKVAEQALRVASVLAVFDGHIEEDGQDGGLISMATLARGIKLAEYSLSEWIRLKETSNVSVDVLHAKNLLQWLQNGGKREVYGAQILQFAPYALRRREIRDRAINVLVTYGWLIAVGGGRFVDGKHRKAVWDVVYEEI